MGGKNPLALPTGMWFATEAVWMGYRVFDCTVVSQVFPSFILYSYLCITEASSLFCSF